MTDEQKFEKVKSIQLEAKRLGYTMEIDSRNEVKRLYVKTRFFEIVWNCKGEYSVKQMNVPAEMNPDFWFDYSGEVENVQHVIYEIHVYKECFFEV